MLLPPSWCQKAPQCGPRPAPGAGEKDTVIRRWLQGLVMSRESCVHQNLIFPPKIQRLPLVISPLGRSRSRRAPCPCRVGVLRAMGAPPRALQCSMLLVHRQRVVVLEDTHGNVVPFPHKCLQTSELLCPAPSPLAVFAPARRLRLCREGSRYF